MMRRTKRGGWPYSQPPNVPFEINRASPQADGLVLWLPWGGGMPGAHRHVDRISGLVFTEGGTPVWVADGERGWSLLFDDVASEYLSTDSTVVTAPPFTMTCWFNTDVPATMQVILFIGDKDIGTHKWALWLGIGPGSGDYLGLEGRGGGGQNFARATMSIGTNTWHHATGIIAAATDRRVLIDAGSEGTNNVDITVAGVDRIAIGAERDSSPGSYTSGMLTDIRIYNRALTDTGVWQVYANPWELYKPLIRRWLGWRSPAPPPVGGHMTLWGRYWGP